MSDPTTEELLTAFFTSTITGLDDDESRRGVLRTLVAHGDKIGADEGSVSRVAAQLRSLDERSGGAFWPRLLLSGVGDGRGGGGSGGDDPVDGQQLVSALLRAMPSLGDDVLRACVTAPGKGLLETCCSTAIDKVLQAFSMVGPPQRHFVDSSAAFQWDAPSAAGAQQLSAASAPSSEESTIDDAQLIAADPQKWRWFFWRREAVLSSDPNAAFLGFRALYVLTTTKKKACN